MMDKHQPEPDCFGVLEIVFPMSDDGLRHSPENCMICFHKTECLRSAIKNPDGLKVKEEIIDRAYEAKNIGFWQRWSRRKYLKKIKKDNT
jgi:hypothetical protein